MRIKRHGFVRADGRLYCSLRLLDVDFDFDAWPSVSATCEGNDVPVEIFPLENGADARDWVVVMPFFAQSTFDVRVCAGEHSSSFSVPCARARWESSVHYRLHKDFVEQVAGVQEHWLDNRFRPTLDRLLCGKEADTWRACVTWCGDEAVCPSLKVLDEHGSVMDVEVFEFERQLGVDASWGGEVNRIYYSLRLPVGCKSFALLASDCTGTLLDGFCSCDEPFWRFREHESWLHMRDARADDAKYRTWFEGHRAHKGDLALQAGAAFSYNPLISVVVPCFNSNPGFLAELVDSVRRQSYAKWELLLVDASAGDGVVTALVKTVGDERIRIVSLDHNKGIVGNTNAGIEEAQGEYIAFLDHDDLLEPDALFWYVRALNDSSRPDVLFCDEDLFERAGEWRQPIFKTRLNVDLLYSHNCVTHFLCISRELVARIWLSSEDVSGAQDYDLTLRALAAGATFRHVARVLYHWREHAGSTSGDNAGSKPYAIEAGRLALQRHFDERGIRAAVEEAPQPFVYRVRYELPCPLPLVSVIIPSRDHADVLATCVNSLFDRAAYASLEVLVIENNSREDRTFETYRALEAAHGSSFRVLDVSERVEGFNYSRLINLGVEAAQGEYLLLLNNDTEVMTSDFIEEMLGYLQRPEVGVVGAKLYFRDGLTQHAGVLVGPHGAVAHANQDFEPAREGYLARACRPGNFSAVTGACQMVRRSTFDEVGGYDERLAVGFNDVDFCFRVREAGKLVVFTPYAELYHYEFVSRGREVAHGEKLERWKREQALFTERWPKVFLEGDPFTNPNFDPNSAYYGL